MPDSNPFFDHPVINPRGLYGPGGRWLYRNLGEPWPATMYRSAPAAREPPPCVKGLLAKAEVPAKRRGAHPARRKPRQVLRLFLSCPVAPPWLRRI